MTTAVLDANLPIDSNVPMWSQTRWNGCWNAEANVGIFVHAGCYRPDPRLWWVHQIVFLPEGKLVVQNYWTRNSSDAGVKTELLDLEMTATGWRSTYDGVGQLTSTAELIRAARGASAPWSRVSWDVTATDRTPAWQMYSSVDHQQDFATKLHMQQVFNTSGTLMFDGVEYPLEGIGFKDHSAGARTWESWNGHRFLIGTMPDYTIHAVTIVDAEGKTGTPFGSILSLDGGRSEVSVFDAEPLLDLSSDPVEKTIVVTGTQGEPTTLKAEVLHAFPITITNDNENFSGVDWDAPGNPLVMFECMVRLTDKNGNVGFAHFERSARRDSLR
ncbi:hypothetical protein [Micromonospora sp. WMMD736]|uniref:hypothetical protein n=1 Tax=Micromonospora sp. WMMD736 TaxID=3404112 RepID=UPI003B938082